MSVYIKSYVKKMCLQQFPKNTNVRFSTDAFGQEFRAAGPACEKARSPNLVRSCAGEKSVYDVDLRR